MRNVNATLDQATPRHYGIYLIAFFATLQQIQIGRSAFVFVRLDVPINAFITEFFFAVFVVACTVDLLMAPLFVAQ